MTFAKKIALIYKHLEQFPLQVPLQFFQLLMPFAKENLRRQPTIPLQGSLHKIARFLILQTKNILTPKHLLSYSFA